MTANGRPDTVLITGAGTQRVEHGAEPIVDACVAEALPAGFMGRSGALPW